VDLIREIDPFVCFPYLATPAIGTELYEMVKDQAGDVPFENVSFADPSRTVSRHINEEKDRVIEKAMVSLSRLNKTSMVLDFFKRPRFWWFYAADTGSWRHPSHVLDYLYDFFKS
jgi:hypothetical protein